MFDTGIVASTGTTVSGPGSTTAVAETIGAAGDAEARAEAALSLLCEEQGARGGHLYVVVDAGLKLVASNGADPADGQLESIVTRFLRESCQQEEAPTQVETNVTGQTATTAALWTAASGTVYRFLILSDEGPDGTLYVGIAALVVSDSRRKPSSIAAAVGRCLLQAGDVHGMQFTATRTVSNGAETGTRSVADLEETEVRSPSSSRRAQAPDSRSSRR